MKVTNKTELSPIESKHGERLYELTYGTNQHSIAYVELLPGKSSISHYHPIIEETYYIISGEAVLVIDSEEKKISQGDCVSILPNKWHQIHNQSTELVSFLAICSPAWTPDCIIFKESVS